MGNSAPPKPVYHIAPIGDIYPHELNASGECWCCPTLDYECFDPTYVHNSYDRREDYEEGWRKPH